MRGRNRNTGGTGYPAPKRGQRNRNRNRGSGRGQGRGGGQGRGQNQNQKLPPYLQGPRSPKEIRRETRADTNLKYRPLERAIGADIRASDRRVGEVGDWWQNYLDTVSEGRSETQAAYQQAGAEGTAQIDAASAADATRTDALQAEAAKSAELRGAPPSTDLAGREAAAQAQRNYLAAAQGGATAQMGANQYAYLTDQKRIGMGQSIASRKEEQRRGRTFRKDRRDVRRDRGESAAAKRGELLDKEREYQIQRGAFGLDKQKAAADEREGAADRAQRERASRRTAQSNARSNAQDERASKRGAREDRGKSAADRREAKAEYRTEVREAGALLRRADAGDYDSPQAAVDYLIEKGVSPRAAKAAVKRAEAQAKARGEAALKKDYPHR